MKRSKFGLSFMKLLSCKMGSLVPVGWLEVLPGDTLQHATSIFLRAAPLVAPVMHPTQLRVHHFFVPYRLLWSNWESFITGGVNGQDASVFPTITLSAPAVGALSDYLGVPLLSSGTIAVSALPFRAYNLIYNEFFRDEDLSPLAGVTLTDGVDSTTGISLLNCAWEKDYFTSARPWEQKGAAVTLPLGGQVPITGLGTANQNFSTGGTVYESDGTAHSYPYQTLAGADILMRGTAATGGYPAVFGNLSEATSVDINTLRTAFALQRFQEARAKFGSRYTEYLAYLGVRSADSRLQRPEYLGGGIQTLQFSEVLQTAPTNSGDPGGGGGVGQFGGHGIAAHRTNRYRRFFSEHGMVMSFLSVRPRTIYSSGLKRQWNRRVRTDFWQKELEHIGQQQVLNQEVCALGSAGGADTGIFGYQDRYDEYRRSESEVSGEFRTDLNFWNLARQFSAYPTLNNAFVQCIPDTRIFADTGDDNLYIMASHNIQARRLVTPKASGLSF